MYSAIVSLPRSSAIPAQAVFTELVSAVVRSICPKSSPAKLSSGVPEITFPFSPLDRRVGLVAAAVERRRRGHGLEGRARREAALGGAVEGLGVLGVGRIEGRRGGEHEHGAGLDVERHDGAVAVAEPVVRGLLALGRQRAAQVVADVARPEQALERADRVAAAAGQGVVVELLEADPPAVERGEADRVREQLAGRIAALVAVTGQRAVGRQHLAVGGADDAALDPLLLEQDAAVAGVVAQALGAEHRPPRAGEHERPEQHQEQPEQADDRGVHRRPLRPIAPSGRRAWSDTSSSSASSTKLARIDDPP